jgi:hypothetical protein
MISLKSLRSNDQIWKRPIPICGSIYSKMIFLISLNYMNQFFDHHYTDRYFDHRADFGFAVIGVLFFTIGSTLIVFELNSIKKQRNQAAGELHNLVTQALLKEQKVPIEFSLFLRRFGAEKIERSIWPPIHPVLIHRFVLPNTFESFLSDQMHGWCPLVGLGRLEEVVGAGKILSLDSEWQLHIKELLRGAKIIFLIPALSHGTMWETREILNDRALLSKTVVLARPEFYGGDIKGEWQAIRKAYLNDFMCTFPEYDTRGVAFSLSGKFESERPYFIGAKRTKSQIRKILLQLGLIHADTFEVINKEYPTRCADWLIAFIFCFGISLL